MDFGSRPRQMTVEGLHALACRGAQFGARPKFDERSRDDRGRLKPLRQIQWSLSGGCVNPPTVKLWSKVSSFMSKTPQPYSVEMEVRCRKCGWCLLQRRHMWAHRAVEEYTHSVRTWFGTLTLSPENHFRALTRARSQELRRSPVPWDDLAPQAQFCALVREHGHDLTNFVKRVRKNSGAPMRYLIVAEAHKTGLPHFHMLVHEADFMLPVRKAVLKAAWSQGFTKWTLVNDPRAASYVCKYLAKDALTRVRASVRYGQGPLGSQSEHPVRGGEVDPLKVPAQRSEHCGDFTVGLETSAPSVSEGAHD